MIEQLLSDIEKILYEKYDKFTADLLSHFINADYTGTYTSNEYFTTKENISSLNELKADLLKYTCIPK
jgi:hypothetical protein